MDVGKPGTGRTVMVGAVRWNELCPSGRQALLNHGFALVENEYGTPLTQEQVIAAGREADAAISGVEVYDATVLAACPNLKIIARLGVGLDNIDLVEARRRGVSVVNVPGGNAAAVGELALLLALAVMRRLNEMQSSLRAGKWDRIVGTELYGKTVGLVGIGATARQFAQRLRGFECDIKAFDPYASPDVARSVGARLVSLDEVADSDLISVHAPHTPQTTGIVGSEFLAKTRHGAVLINTSRGPLVDEAALLDALTSGHLAGAGLDVFAIEPPMGSPLLGLPTVVATPHGGADSWEAYNRIGLSTAQAIIDVFSGNQPDNLAN